MELETICCPLCKGDRHRPCHVERGFAYVLCRDCGLIYLNPRPTPAALKEHYQTYLPADEVQIKAWRRAAGPVFERSARLLETRKGGPGRILDIGTGFGFFLRLMADRGWETVGLEISGPGARYGREVLGLDVRQTLLEEADFPEGSFDAVTAFYVIEHLPDPVGTCRALARLLRPGGQLLLRWPHTAPLIRLTWPINLDLFHAPSHLCQFSPQTMTRMLNEAGFTDVKTFIGGWTRPARPLGRIAGLAGGLLAETLSLLTAGNILLPGVSKTTVASLDIS
jgi:SAM-dependent methyltransferase